MTGYGPENAPLQYDHLEYLPSGPDQDNRGTAPPSPVAPTQKVPPVRVEPTHPAPKTIVQPPKQAPPTLVETTHRALTAIVWSYHRAPTTLVEPTHPAPTTPVERPQMSNQQAMVPETPQVDTKMQGHLPTLAGDRINYDIWKQTLHDIAIINNFEGALDESSPPPTVTSPYHSMYCRICAFLRMSIMNSLPSGWQEKSTWT